MAAKYLVAHPDYSTGLVDKIRELEQNFLLDEYSVDTCPTEDGSALHLRGGNKRSIAYVMRLLQGKDIFQPVIIRDWQKSFVREDMENLNGLPTTDDPVIHS